MTQSDFNAAFQQQVSGQLEPPPHDPRYITNQILRRDQRRASILAGLSLLCWLIGAAGMLLMVIGLNRFILMMRISQSMESSSVLWGTDLIHHSIPFIECSIISLMLAALFTVMLIFSLRQATLNRIHISLAQMSEQLKQPQSPSATNSFEAPSVAWNEPRFPRFVLAISLLAIIACAITLALLTYLFSASAQIASYGKPTVFAESAPSMSAGPLWQGYPVLSPFQAVRWHDDTPTVEVNGTWYELEKINDSGVKQIIAFDKSLGPTTWQKHFEEDLVELMTRLGHAPGTTVNLRVKEPDSGKERILKDVPMTSENRWALWSARQKAEHALQTPPQTQP